MCANIMFVIGALIVMLACFLAGFGLCAKLTNDAISGGRTNWLHNLFGWCPHCMMWFQDGVKRRRQNTAYEDDESNFVVACKNCFEEIQEYWAERWAEYHSSIY